MKVEQVLNVDNSGEGMTVGELRASLDPSGENIGLLIQGGKNHSLIVAARGDMMIKVLRALERHGIIEGKAIMRALGIDPKGAKA